MVEPENMFEVQPFIVAVFYEEDFPSLKTYQFAFIYAIEVHEIDDSGISSKIFSNAKNKNAIMNPPELSRQPKK